jgi:hypothetical protein
MKAVLGATARVVVAQEKDEEELGESGNVGGGGALGSSPTDSKSSMPSSAGALDSNNSSTNNISSVRGCWRSMAFNETWFFHDLPVETISYSRFSDDSKNKSFLMYVGGWFALDRGLMAYWHFRRGIL